MKLKQKNKFMDRVINKKQATDLVRRFIESELNNETWYQKIKDHCVAIILYGSVAKEVNRADSDVDVLLILPLEMEEKYTIGEYFYSFEGEKVNVVIRSIERLRKIVEEKNDSLQKEVFRNAEIIWSRGGEIAHLLKNLEK